MPKAPKGIPREHPNAAFSHMGDRCVAATSLRCCGGTPGDQDGRGTNELSKIESILGARMSQNLSRDRRLACRSLSLVRRARDLVNSSTWSFCRRAATCLLMYSEPLSEWNPQMVKGKAWMSASSTGNRKRSEMRSTEPTNWNWVTSSTRLMW